MRLSYNISFGIYNHTFGYIEKNFGYEALIDYWNYLSERFCQGRELDELIKEYGVIDGSKKFWGKAITEEGSEDFTLKDYGDSLKIEIYDCPPIKWKKSNNIKNYKKYCEHCRSLWGPIIRKHGYTMNLVYDIDGKSGKCARIIKKIDKYGN